MDIGRPQRIIEVEPVSLPVPSPGFPEPVTPPVHEPEPAAPARDPVEPVDP